jgi:hypothetical protein
MSTSRAFSSALATPARTLDRGVSIPSAQLVDDPVIRCGVESLHRSRPVHGTPGPSRSEGWRARMVVEGNLRLIVAA